MLTLNSRLLLNFYIIIVIDYATLQFFTSFNRCRLYVVTVGYSLQTVQKDETTKINMGKER